MGKEITVISLGFFNWLFLCPTPTFVENQKLALLSIFGYSSDFPNITTETIGNQRLRFALTGDQKG